MQQDAHEFFNYLLNAISETLSEAEDKKKEIGNGIIKVNGLSKKSIQSSITPNGTDGSRYIFLV